MEQEIDKKMKNECFMVAIDHIFKEGMVDSQKELAEKIGITESTLSRIKNNKKFVGDETLRKMNEAFGGIFNMAFFRAKSVYLLKEDAADAMLKSVGKGSPPRNAQSLPDPSSIIEYRLLPIHIGQSQLVIILTFVQPQLLFKLNTFCRIHQRPVVTSQFGDSPKSARRVSKELR